MGVMAKTSLLGVCVIGAGRAGMIHARNFSFGRVTQAALAAIVEPSEPARQAVREELRLEQVYVDYRQALADPSVAAVVVATPSEHHCEIVVAAARAGKHILCEKPMAMNVRECDEMLAAVDRAGVKFQIGFMRRFDAGFVAARRQIEAGEIGRVVLVKSLTYGPSIPKPWMYNIRESNGPLSEVNSHDIDTLRWFSSSEFEEVYTIAGNYRSPDAVEMYPDFYDNVVLSAHAERHAGLDLRGAGCPLRLRRALGNPGGEGADHRRQPGGGGGDHPQRCRQHNADRAKLDRLVPRCLSYRG